MEQMNFPILEAWCAKIQAKKKILLISTPILFVVFVAMDFCIAKQYESEVIIARETEEAVEVNRAITLNRPEQYDLGLARTDNSVRILSYESIIYSPSFLSGLLSTPVSRLDGSWEGSYATYLMEEAHHPFWERAKGVAEGEVASGVLSKAQIAAIEAMKDDIDVKVDKLSEVLTITVRSQDPLISVQVARALTEHLRAFLGAYERSKMETTLEQLEQLVDNARENYSPEVYQSFERQMIVYKAQMLFHPSFVELSSPEICYKSVGPSRWKMPLVLTIVVELMMMMWFGRKEMLEILKQL